MTIRAKWNGLMRRLASKRTWILAGMALGVFALGFGVHWLVSDSAAPGVETAPVTHEHGRSAAAEATMWTCSMHPQVRLPRPGNCPICGMKLIPLRDLEKEPTPPPGLDVEPVTRRPLAKEVRTVGRLDYSEAGVEYITARVAGRVDRLYADFTGIPVRKGDHLVDIYSPDLYAAQQELLLALEAQERSGRSGRSGSRLTDGFTDRFEQEMLESAREKLRLWDITPEQIAEFERTRKLQKHVTVYAPLGGTVVEKNVRLGQYVQPGDPLYRIAGLDPMWLYLDLYESDVGWVQYGRQVHVSLEAFPGEAFQGTVAFIDPFLNEQTRTVRVRVNMPNPDGRLKAGMYAMTDVRVPLTAGGGPAETGLEGKYFCPMHPDVVEDDPGTCRVCGMDLVRVPEHGPYRPASGAAPHRHEATRGATPPEPDGPAGHKSHGEGQAETPPPGREPGRPLAIRASAVLDTGRRQVTFRQTDKGHFELVELRLGPRAVGEDDAGRTANYFVVLAGLSEGDRVAVRGGFLLDSQAQIEGRPSLLYPEGQSAADLHSGHAMSGTSPSGAPSRGASPRSAPPPGAGHRH